MQDTKLAVIAAAPETAAQRAARLQGEAKQAAAQAVSEAMCKAYDALAALEQVAALEAAPAGIRDIARQVVVHLPTSLQSIEAIMGRR